jgi:hypothetical protein
MSEENIGYLKYEGKLVEAGLLDARKAAQALLGFDEAIRFFVGQQSVVLRDLDFEIPVRVREGSWEALIPNTLIEWVQTAIGAGATTYVITAAKKLAEHDFDKKGLKDVFQRALEAIQWMIRIGKHLGDLTKKRFESVRFRNENTEIGLPNSAGELLFIPRYFFDFYVAANPRLLKKIATIVEQERRMEIGLYKDETVVRETISYKERSIFTHDSTENDIIFPELTHGKEVVLEGHITRGNESTNSLGFMYKGHILSCFPEKGSVIFHKPAMFLNCKITGSVSRQDKFGGYNEVKPRILFSRIEPIESNGNSGLFGPIA